MHRYIKVFRWNISEHKPKNWGECTTSHLISITYFGGNFKLTCCLLHYILWSRSVFWLKISCFSTKFWQIIITERTSVFEKVDKDSSISRQKFDLPLILIGVFHQIIVNFLCNKSHQDVFARPLTIAIITFETNQVRSSKFGSSEWTQNVQGSVFDNEPWKISVL